MIKDKVISLYIDTIRSAIEAQKEALVRIDNWDQLRRAQGQIDGLREALSLLEGVLEEQDT